MERVSTPLPIRTRAPLFFLSVCNFCKYGALVTCLFQNESRIVETRSRVEGPEVHIHSTLLPCLGLEVEAV